MGDSNSSSTLAKSPAKPIYIVGIGASAGGLEAIEEFFDHMPSDTGMAFVIVQHLSPDFKSLMGELLARHTEMKIHSVVDGMTVEANQVYLIPPRKNMILRDGKLLLEEQAQGRSLNLPIDIFFDSLAADAPERSVAVVLSGTGSDGSRGLQRVHESGGLVICQSVASAGFDGMPKSAKATGMVDVVSSPKAMPSRILQFVEAPEKFIRGLVDEDAPMMGDDETAILFRLFRRQFGVDFARYRATTINRRIDRRLQLTGCKTLEDYLRKLDSDPSELDVLYRDLLVEVTQFFRDPSAFRRIREDVIPRLIDECDPNGQLRIWVPACATGEEAYSLAIIAKDCIAKSKGKEHIEVKIFATDVHQTSLEIAAAGVYSAESVQSVPSDLRTNYFSRSQDLYHVVSSIRQSVIFAPHDITSDPPFTKIDLISCRNALIYLIPPVQRKAIALFHFGLRVGGCLFLGPSESLADATGEFETIDSQWRIFSKLRDVRLLSSEPEAYSQPLKNVIRSRPTFISTATQVGSGWLIPEIHEELLREYVPPSLLINEENELVHSFGNSRQYLQQPEGKATLDVLRMVHGDMRIALGSALQKARSKREIVVLKSVPIVEGENRRLLKIIAKPYLKAKEMFVLILLEEEAEGPIVVAKQPDGEAFEVDQQAGERIMSLERELAFSKESLQATVEELETSNEELQSTNEELVASNEELQSTNEELHSVNEELYAVNAEYQRKITELTELTDDMDNLLNSTHIDTIFLDRKLRVRKFTPDVAEKFSLMRQDIGRSFENFTYRLDDDELISELKQVIETEQPFLREVRDRNRHIYLMRILPYISRGSVEGVVLTLVDVTMLKETESRLAVLSEIVEQSSDAIFRVDLNGIIQTWNSGAKSIYRRGTDTVGKHLDELFPESLNVRSEDVLQSVSRTGNVVQLQPYEVLVEDQTLWISTLISPVLDTKGSILAASVISRDVSEQVYAQAEIRQSIERRDQFLAMLSHELRNPLGALLNASRLLKGPEISNDIISQASDVITRQSQQMSRLLDDLLDVSRVTLGKIELRREVFDFSTTLEYAVDALNSQFDENAISFTFNRAEKEIFVDGDPARLQQVVVNLLRNAIKYTASGGTIELSVRIDEHDVEVRVRDNGIGIESEMLDKIFEMFVQVNSSIERSQGGIGLGLTLVKAVVEMHDGTVEVFSEGLGQGSEFRVRLPWVDVDRIPAKVQPLSSGLVQEVKTVVVVEDIGDARVMLCELLKMQGLTVYSAECGETGLKLIKEKMPDLSLIDIGLPKLDGYEVAKILRADPACSSMRLVALTGYGQSSDQDAVKKAGFDHHLVKPLNMDELEKLL